MRHTESGFTAIELIVVILIIGLVAFMAIPLMANVLDALDVSKAKGAAEQVASAIEQTRAYAILQSCTYRVAFPGNNQFQISPDPGTCATSATGEGPTPLANNGQVTPQGGTDGGCGGGWCIWFNSTGTSIAKSIIVNAGPDQRTVTVTVAGRVQVTVP